jgi:hypothetical protein
MQQPRALRFGTTAFAAGLLATVTLFASHELLGAGPKFYDDDPIAVEPETQDASGAEEYDVDLFWDLSYNLFARPGDPRRSVRAQNINTIDEVPDSGWFTNRVLSRPLTTDDVAVGPLTGPAPAGGRWTIVRQKTSGAAPGFVGRDEKGETWFVSFDARGYPEAASGAILVANKIFWALGYWQVENFLTSIRPEQVVIADATTFRPPSRRRRPMRQSDVDDVFARAHRGPDGSYRAIAARSLTGTILGGFQYFGTRPDDPNDIVPHEHRRELRALKVFGAWTNLVDMKAGNTLDTVVQEQGKGVVRHYLQDVGSTFGTGANDPHDWDEGWEYLYEGARLAKRLVSFGFYLQPWQTIPYDEHDAIGRFEGQAFDPRTWRPRVPTAAFLRARPDDDFWAARRVAAFSDELIRAMVRTGAYGDPAAEKHLGDVLIARRDRIAQAYLPAVNPVVDVSLDASGALTFQNAAVQAGVAPAPKGGYAASWFRFDNATGQTTPLGQPTASSSNRVQAPSGLPAAIGDFIKVQISAIDPPQPSWSAPVDAFFRRTASGWKLVGFERIPDGEKNER